jgi:hypothetical protein
MPSRGLGSDVAFQQSEIGQPIYSSGETYEIRHPWDLSGAGRENFSSHGWSVRHEVA